MGRRSDARRVEEFILFDVLYEDGSRTSNRKVPGSELGGFEGDVPAKTYIEAQDRQIAEISGKPRSPIKSGLVSLLRSDGFGSIAEAVGTAPIRQPFNRAEAAVPRQTSA